MKSTSNTLSNIRINRLRVQGFVNQTDEELNDMAFGIRFAYRTCLAIVIAAMVTQSIALFAIMLGIAFLGIVLPNHPFDYIYNYPLSKWMNKRKLPPRPMQLKFACIMATMFLSAIVYLLSQGFATSGLILAGALAITASLPSTIDFCVPSVIYNALFQKK